MSDYQRIADKLTVGVWSSPTSFIKESEDFAKETDFDTYRYGISEENIKEDPKFYGYDPNSTKTIKEQYQYENVLKFSQPDLLSKAINAFDDVITRIDFGGNLEKTKLKFTSIPQGVFNFGLASKGLFRPIEYFSTVENRLIDPEKVLNTEFKGMKYFYFLDSDGNESPIRIQQEGTYLVEKNCGNIVVKYDNSAKMFLPYQKNKPYIGCGKKDEQTGKPSKLRFSTTTKKVYMYREKQGGGLTPYVDLFLVIGGLADMTTESMLVKNLPLLIISKFLNEAGIKTRIYAKRAYNVSSKIVDYSFVVKDYGEPLDINQIAAFTSDKRFFRVNLWNTVPSLVKKITGETVTGYGSTLYGRTSPKYSDALIPAFNMSKNWALNTSQNAIKTSKVSDPRLMVLGGVGDISGEDKLDNPKTVEKIINEIYRIGDYVSLMFSKNPRKTISSIYNREKERNDNTEYIKDYVVQTILDNLVTIRPSQLSPQYQNLYTTPKNLIEDIDEQSDELLNTIKEVIR